MEEESSTHKDQQSGENSNTKASNAMAENLADDALNSKTIVDYNGTNINVTNIDGVNDTNA